MNDRLCACYISRIIKDFDNYVSSNYEDGDKSDIEAFIRFELKLLRNAFVVDVEDVDDDNNEKK